MKTYRILGAGRLSREREESTSEPRQRKTVSGIADMIHGVVVAWVFDSGVSGRVAPFERDKLGPWFRAITPACETGACGHDKRTPCMGQWDVLAAWKMDRITRRALHFHTLMEWMKAHGKAIVTSDVNTTSKAGRQTAELMAMVASWEWEAIQERTKDAWDALVLVGRYPGGNVPYGYRAVKQETGEGWRIEPHPPTHATTREMVQWSTDGHGDIYVTAQLNKRKEMAPSDVQRILRGKDPKGIQWHPTTVRKILGSRALLGYMDGLGGPVIGDDGLEVRRAEPLITDDEFEALQAARAARSSGRGHARKDAAQLTKVAECGICGRNMSTSGTSDQRAEGVYRCNSAAVTGASCGNRTVRRSALERMVEESFLYDVGDLEVVRRIYVPGRDNRRDIEDLQVAVKRLAASLGQLDAGPALESVVGVLNSHNAQLKVLEAEPVVPERWIEEPTGETFARMWARLDDRGRGDLLRASGVRAVWGRKDTLKDGTVIVIPGTTKIPILNVILPPDLQERAIAHAAAHDAQRPSMAS